MYSWIESDYRFKSVQLGLESTDVNLAYSLTNFLHKHSHAIELFNDPLPVHDSGPDDVVELEDDKSTGEV